MAGDNECGGGGESDEQLLLKKIKQDVRTSHKGLDMNAVSYKVNEGWMETKGREMNLVVGGDIKEEDSIRELRFDDVIPEPLHGGTIGDVGRVGWPSTASELGNEVVVGTDDGSSRVAASREQTQIVVIRIHRCLNQVKGAEEAIMALTGLEIIETTDGNMRCEAALEDELREVALDVLAVRLHDLGGGENDFEQINAILRVIKLGGHIVPRVHETHEFPCLDLHA